MHRTIQAADNSQVALEATIAGTMAAGGQLLGLERSQLLDAQGGGRWA